MQGKTAHTLTTLFDSLQHIKRRLHNYHAEFNQKKEAVRKFLEGRKETVSNFGVKPFGDFISRLSNEWLLGAVGSIFLVGVAFGYWGGRMESANKVEH